MEKSQRNKVEKKEMHKTSVEKTGGQFKTQTHLSEDREFEKLRETYQNAAFADCEIILEGLEDRYPDHPILQNYREEINIRLRVKSIENYKKKAEKRKKRIMGLRLSLFALVSTLLVFVTFIYSYFYFYIQVSADEILEESAQLADLSKQIDHLLLVGKPRAAADVLNQIRKVDSSFEPLAELEAQTYQLLLLEAKYDNALLLVQEGQDQDALLLFQEIESEWPGLWDVRQQIEELQNSNQTKQIKGLSSIPNHMEEKLFARVIFEEIIDFQCVTRSTRDSTRCIDFYFSNLS